MTLQDEASVKSGEQQARRAQLRRAKKLILEGSWDEVYKLCSKFASKTQNHMFKSFLYTMHKQQYLELLERQEMQKAFAHLTKRLKPLEGYQAEGTEFRDLCYMLTCKSVQDVPAFKEWDVASGRQLLCDQFSLMNNLDAQQESTDGHGSGHKVPTGRLVSMLQQAVAYQIEFNRYHPAETPKINTLLEDYQSCVLPNQELHTLVGHTANVKCVHFVGAQGKAIATGSSDRTVKLWDTVTGDLKLSLPGHTGRIWNLDSSTQSERNLLASASGDGTVRLWALDDVLDDCGYTGRAGGKPEAACVSVLDGDQQGHDGDIYSVEFHPDETHLVTGGYDKTVKLFDISTGQVVKTFVGHTSAVSSAIFNPYGNLVVTASKDSTIRFWDIVSGACINTFSRQLGEVTSVQISTDGSMLLSGSKDNSNRLWDVRMLKPIRKYKGHSNTTKSFIRCIFGAHQQTVFGGSEDGRVYMWDFESAALLNSCVGHEGVVYDVAWNSQQSLLATASDDNTARIWGFDPNLKKPGIRRSSSCTFADMEADFEEPGRKPDLVGYYEPFR